MIIKEPKVAPTCSPPTANLGFMVRRWEFKLQGPHLAVRSQGLSLWAAESPVPVGRSVTGKFFWGGGRGVNVTFPDFFPAA